MPPIIPQFKSEHSLWIQLVEGQRTFDMRRYDVADERVYALMWTDSKGVWEVSTVEFVDKETEIVAMFEYRGMEFTDWANGWCFLKLGDLKNKHEVEGILKRELIGVAPRD